MITTTLSDASPETTTDNQPIETHQAAVTTTESAAYQPATGASVVDTVKSTHPEILVSAVLHLMSHYTTNSALNSDQGVCVKLAAVIERHLKILADLPELAPVLRATCQQLCEQWTLVVEHTMQKQDKPPFLARWKSTAHP